MWQLIKDLLAALFRYFRAKDAQRQKDEDEAAESMRVRDELDRREIEDVKEEIKKDIAESDGDPDAYERAFDRVRKLQTTDE